MDDIARFDYMHCIMICKNLFQKEERPWLYLRLQKLYIQRVTSIWTFNRTIELYFIWKNIERMIVNRIQIFVRISKIPGSENSHKKHIHKSSIIRKSV